jgi:hypothetical protein
MATQLEWERRIGYGVLLAAALLLTGRVLGGIWEALLLAAVLAAGLSPVQERLTAALGNRPTVSALGLTVGTLLFLLVPLTLLVIYLVGQAIHLVQHVREIASRSGPEEVIQAPAGPARTDCPHGAVPLRHGQAWRTAAHARCQCPGLAEGSDECDGRLRRSAGSLTHRSVPVPQPQQAGGGVAAHIRPLWLPLTSTSWSVTFARSLATSSAPPSSPPRFRP